MTAMVKKWGNSLAVRIPKDIARTLQIHNDQQVELRIEGESLVIKPMQALTLDELVEKIEPSNLHAAIETQRVGNEEW